MKNENPFDMYLNEVGNCTILSKEEILKLAVQAKNGNHLAREKIARANLKFVISLAKQYSTKYGFDLEDLIASGNIGLTIALNKFDPSMNYAFTTYAQFWIRSEMNNTMNKNHDIVLPRKSAGKLSKTVKTFASSIDDENFKESSICSDYSYSPEEEFSKKEVSDSVKKALNSIKVQEAEIIRMHYGIGCEPRSLQTIGKMYGLTKERIRQIEKVGFEHLKNSGNGKYLDGLTA